MSTNNPIIHYYENGIEMITNNRVYGKILDMIPVVHDDGKIVAIKIYCKINPAEYVYFYTSYQRSFMFCFEDGHKLEIKGNHQITDDMEFNKKLLQFVNDFHDGKFENNSKLHIVQEIEFMDI